MVIVAPPEPVWWTDRLGDIRPGLLLRLDPEAIQIWPGDDRVLSAWEFLRLWGWRIMTDPTSGGILDLFAWGLVVEKRPGGEDLTILRRPGGDVWTGTVSLAADWLERVRERKGRLVQVHAVPDSSAVLQLGPLAERVRKAADNEQLLGGRIPIRDAA